MSDPLLTPAQARVIASLVEKSITTPQYYPMTVNAIMAACNQKTVRNPIMSLSERDVGGALADLEAMKFATRDDYSGRVPKWRQQFQHQMLLKAPTMAVLVTLMLRGPQTAAELRSNASALGGPGDAAGVDEALELLSDRAEPLVKQLPRAPGQAASRVAHLLCGEDAIPAEPASGGGSRGGTDSAALLARIDALEARVAALESERDAG